MTEPRKEVLSGLVFRVGEVEAASEFVRRTHYSGTIQNPSAIICVGTWHEEGGLFGDRGEIVAACVFGISTSNRKEFVLELTRLCRAPHVRNPLSALISLTCSFIKKKKIADTLISFADIGRGHHGGVYQAAGWNYAGLRNAGGTEGIIKDGVYIADRSCHHVWGTRSPSKLKERFPSSTIERKFSVGKHLYWRSLTIKGRAIARSLDLRQLPFPKPNAVSPLDECDTIASETGASPVDRSKLPPDHPEPQ
jgi:hypothetical protein